ncbi:MAG TPA: maleylpyruvate isomerase family mycothiol-dependent enzyme [Streptosporangiaceae bacterium]|jgi:uncharacterized protein (TIGR03083 family)
MLTGERYYAGIREPTARLAGIVATADQATHIPSCPDWTLRQLATHLGRGQRWAAEIVRRRSPEFIAFRDVPDGRIPDDPAARPDWLNAGPALLTGTLADAGQEHVWTFLGMRPASFWARRMAHETAVHVADAELATGHSPSIPADLAADAIDEWLMLLGQDSDGDMPLAAERQTLHLHATDDGLDGTGEWLVRSAGQGIAVEPGHAKADAALRGPAASLLLVLLRRLPLATPGVELLGDGTILSHWLARTPY